MEINIKRFKTIYIFLLNGELDLYNASKVEKYFHSVCSRDITALILDFEDVSYIDSSGLGSLLKLKSLSSEKKLNFCLSSVTGEVLNVLKLTNLTRFFSISENYQQGIKNFLNGADTDESSGN